MHDMNKRLQKEFKAVIGRRLLSIHAMTQPEAKNCGLEDWFGRDPIICLDFEGGKCLILSADPEGNGPGFAIGGEKRAGMKVAIVRMKGESHDSDHDHECGREDLALFQAGKRSVKLELLDEKRRWRRWRGCGRRLRSSKRHEPASSPPIIASCCKRCSAHRSH